MKKLYSYIVGKTVNERENQSK